jgi:CubicO group peptidase (beta-lactamase class C family)
LAGRSATNRPSGSWYGLGFGPMIQPTPGAAEPVLDSYFWAGAYSTNFWVDPRRDITGVVMTQVQPVTRDTQIVPDG